MTDGLQMEQGALMDHDQDDTQDDTQSERRDWYALAIKHQHERTVVNGLEGSGFETLLPIYKTLRQWSDRTKELEAPLFAGYCIAQISLMTPGSGFSEFQP